MIVLVNFLGIIYRILMTDFLYYLFIFCYFLGFLWIVLVLEEQGNKKNK